MGKKTEKDEEAGLESDDNQTKKKSKPKSKSNKNDKSARDDVDEIEKGGNDATVEDQLTKPSDEKVPDSKETDNNTTDPSASAQDDVVEEQLSSEMLKAAAGIEIVSEDVPPSVAPPTSSVVEMTPAEEMIDPEVAAALAEEIA